MFEAIKVHPIYLISAGIFLAVLFFILFVVTRNVIRRKVQQETASVYKAYDAMVESYHHLNSILLDSIDAEIEVRKENLSLKKKLSDAGIKDDTDSSN